MCIRDRHTTQRQSVVNRGSAATYASMSFYPHYPFFFSIFCKNIFFFLVIHHKANVHYRAIFFFYLPIEKDKLVDKILEQCCFFFIVFFYCIQPNFFYPFQCPIRNIYAKNSRCVFHRLIGDMHRIIYHFRKVFILFF